jgi:hypothetical protein
LGEAATGFLADFRLAGTADRFGFAAEFVRLATGRLAATARVGLDLLPLAVAVFEIFCAGFALAFFGAADFAGLDFFAFFAGAAIGLAGRAFAGTATGLATGALARFEGLAAISEAFVRFGAVAEKGADVVVLTLGFGFMLGWSAFRTQLNERAVCRSSTISPRCAVSASFKIQTTLAAFCFTHLALLCFFSSAWIDAVSPRQIVE